MVFKENFIAVLKCAGRIMRERGDLVTLPFGSEYSIHLKNLETRRALVHIEVDGQLVTGGGLIVSAGNVVDLEGAVLGSEVRNRFKFIQKTAQIQEHRGDRVEDGMVRVRFAFETAPVSPSEPSVFWKSEAYGPRLGGTGDTDDWGTRFKISCSSATLSAECDSKLSKLDCLTRSVSNEAACSLPQDNEGITVPGSASTQRLQPMYMGAVGPEQVIVIRMRGVTENGAPVTVPVTVKHKLQCPTCGTQNSSNQRYCGQCGTALF
jgi:hypothetical protein